MPEKQDMYDAKEKLWLVYKNYWKQVDKMKVK